MVYRHTDEQIQDYFDRDAVNQSTIKVILMGSVQAYLAQKEQLLHNDELYYEEKEHFIVGSAVDCIITQGQEAFKEKYFHSEMKKKPNPIQMAVTKFVFDRVSAFINDEQDRYYDLIDYKQHIYDAFEVNEYFNNRKKANWQEDTRYSTLLKDGLCEQYWKELIASKGKQVLSEEEYTVINDVTMSLLTHKYTRHLFTDDVNMDIIFQMPLYPIIDGVDCKILPDLIIIDYLNQTIHVVDIKTFGDYIESFNWGMKKRRYDIQGAFYNEGIRNSLQQLTQLLGRDVTAYTVGNFTFVVESKVKQGTPLKFRMDRELERVGRRGDGENLKGFYDALSTYKLWTSVDFSMDEVYAPTFGTLAVGADFKYI